MDVPKITLTDDQWEFIHAQEFAKTEATRSVAMAQIDTLAAMQRIAAEGVAVQKASAIGLRDLFAGQALTGLLASGKWHNTGNGFEAFIALQADNIADAMMAAREKKS